MKITLTLTEANEIIRQHPMFDFMGEDFEIIIEALGTVEPKAEPKQAEKPKQTRKRRTKVEMAEEVVTQETLDELTQEVKDEVNTDASTDTTGEVSSTDNVPVVEEQQLSLLDEALVVEEPVFEDMIAQDIERDLMQEVLDETPEVDDFIDTSAPLFG